MRIHQDATPKDMLFLAPDISLPEVIDVNLLVEISPGELIDKITILEIKLERIADPEKKGNVEREFRLLDRVHRSNIENSEKLVLLHGELKRVNEVIWEIEDGIRDHERRRDFGASFVELARGVYHNNDRRAALKREINSLLNSGLIEEKSYTPY